MLHLWSTSIFTGCYLIKHNIKPVFIITQLLASLSQYTQQDKQASIKRCRNKMLADCAKLASNICQTRHLAHFRVVKQGIPLPLLTLNRPLIYLFILILTCSVSTNQASTSPVWSRRWKSCFWGLEGNRDAAEETSRVKLTVTPQLLPVRGFQNKSTHPTVEK